MNSTGPLKPGSGVNTSWSSVGSLGVPPLFRLTSPIGRPVTGSVSTTGVPTAIGCPLISVIVSGPSLPGSSFSSTSIVTGVSSGVVALSPTTDGVSLLGPTVMFRLAVSVPPWPSLSVYTTSGTGPTKSGAGSNV